MKNLKHWLNIAKVLRTERTGDLENIAKPWMLIDGLIPQGSIVIIAGPSYSGKTFLAMEAARAVTTGSDYADHFKVPEYSRGNVLFIEQDSPKYDTGNALWAMIKEQWKTRPESELQNPLEGLHLAWHPGLDLINDEDAVAIAKTANSLFTHLKTVNTTEFIYSEEGDVIGERPTGDQEEEGYRGTKLIVLDTLRALNTGEENESGPMESIMQRLKLIRSLTGATIILTHHTGAGSKRLRGSTAIDGAADCIFYVNGKRGKGSVTVKKARAIQPEDFKFEITSSEHPEYGLTKRVEYRGTVEPRDESEDTMETYLHKEGEVSREQLIEWAALQGMSVPTMDRKLKKIGAVTRLENRKAFYRLSY